MKTRILIVALAVAVLLVSVSLIRSLGEVRLPGNDREYRPVQPIAYSHRVHAGEFAIPCLYCHSGAERSRTAGIPPASVCMNCHQSVTASLVAVRDEERRAKDEGRAPRPVVSPQLALLYAAQGLDAELKPVPGAPSQPIRWVRVHGLPDFVAFDHRPHVASGLECQRCHGPIESMDRVRQFSDLTMGWCVGCHREAGAAPPRGRPVQPSLDCVTCHY